MSPVGQTEILKITVKDEDPELAALIANTESDVFQKEINKMMGEQRIMHLLMSTKITDVIIDNTLYNVETFPITFMKREKY